MKFLSPVHGILLWKLCINCNFNFKESYNHSKLLRIFKGDNLLSLLTPGHFLRNINFLHFFCNSLFCIINNDINNKSAMSPFSL